MEGSKGPDRKQAKERTVKWLLLSAYPVRAEKQVLPGSLCSRSSPLASGGGGAVQLHKWTKVGEIPS